MADDHTFTMSVEGLDELQDSLKRLVRKYPDEAGRMLQREARVLRKEIVAETKELTNTSAKSKMSLGKIGSYSVSKVYGIYTKQYVEIKAKAPHFHLVENGHDLVSRSGKYIRHIEGKHMLDNAVRKHEQKMPEIVEKMVSDLLKREGFI